MENTEAGKMVSGIAADSNDAKITIMGLPDRAGVAYEIFGPLAKASVVVDVIVQTTPLDGKVALSFTVPEVELGKTLLIIEQEIKSRFKDIAINSETNIAKVSIVGVGMHHHPGVAAKMFEILAQEKISIKLITTSEIKVSVLVDKSKMEKAVGALHTAFGLDSD